MSRNMYVLLLLIVLLFATVMFGAMASDVRSNYMGKERGHIEDLEYQVYANERYIRYLEEELTACEAELITLQVFYSDITCP